jgi:hypothetical protein
MPFDPETVVDHFKIWETEHEHLRKPSPDLSVDVEDQFRKGDPLEVSVSIFQWIANPVKKNAGRILHEDLHLTGYSIYKKQGAPAEPVRRVTIRNQFTPRKGADWLLGEPRFLLVPASKRLGGGDPPEEPKDKLDHYLCYDVTEAEAAPENITLEDQFDKHLNRVERINDSLAPKFLGVPTKKNTLKRQLQPDAHLAIYALPKQADEKITISSNDQFRIWRDWRVYRALYLAVPSTKEWHRDYRELGSTGGVVEG